MGPIQQAEQLFFDFTGHEPGKNEILEVKQSDIVCVIGEIEGIAYTTMREGKREKYFHRFKSNRPVLAISSDGKQAYILAGVYKFTDRGFTP